MSSPTLKRLLAGAVALVALAINVSFKPTRGAVQRTTVSLKLTR